MINGNWINAVFYPHTGATMKSPSPWHEGGTDIEGGSDFGPFEVHVNLSTTSAVVRYDRMQEGY